MGGAAMSDYAHAINRIYGQAELGAKILTALREAGKDLETLTRDDLASFDEQHGGGREATRELARLTGLRAGMYVLDVGSGLGGPARTLAAEFGCQVVGIDLTEAFCEVATMLTAQVGLTHKVKFEHGGALKMPFEDATFDVVWTQFAGMNIQDKGSLYAEIRRVLKPGGRLALHEVMAGARRDLHFPVLWANDPILSFLRPPEQIQELLADNGFHKV